MFYFALLLYIFNRGVDASKANLLKNALHIYGYFGKEANSKSTQQSYTN